MGRNLAQCLLQPAVDPVVGLEDAPVKDFTEVKAKILEKLQEPKAQNAIEQYLSNLRKRANIRYQVPKEQILKG